MVEDTARNSKMPHLYYWSSESLKVLDLAGSDLAVTLPAAMREPQGSEDISLVEMQPTHFDQVSTGFDYNRNISSLGEDIMVKTRSKLSGDSVDWRARTKAYAENQGRGRFDRVSTKHGRKGVPEGFDLPPVEVIPSNEVIGGVPLVGRTPDGRPLTGSVAGMEALFEQQAAARLAAVRPIKPRLVDDSDPFSDAAISKRVGFTVKSKGETREERAARIAEEDAERRRLVEAAIRRRLQASIESEAETTIFLMTTPEGREAVNAVMREKAELKAEPMWKPKHAEADEDAA
ncbi:hypothetical protein [Methylobacterium radiodurans]|nr:hypothetical protein [Methylobacterium radiodurans]